MWRGVAQVVGDGQLVPLPIPRSKRSEGLSRSIPIQVVIAGVVIAGAFFCIRSTLSGVISLQSAATRRPHTAAGIRADVKYIVYMISALRGLAGLVETARLGMGDQQGRCQRGIRSRPLLLFGTPFPVVAQTCSDCCGSPDHAGDLHELQHAPHSVHLVVGFEIRNHSFLCSVLRRSNASWLPQRFLRLWACGSRAVSRGSLTSQGPLLLLFSLALSASFRYETF